MRSPFMGKMQKGNLMQFKVHKSHIQEYKVCPYSMYLLEIEQRPIEGTISPLHLGGKFHEFTKHYFENTEVDVELLHPGIQQWAKNFIEWEKSRLEALRKKGLEKYYLPLAIEMFMESEKLPIAGTPDRVDWWIPDKELIVLEYKSGTWFEVSSIRQELTLYALLAEEHFGLPCRMIGAFRPTVNEFWFEMRKSQSEKALMKNINLVLEAIDTEWFPPKVGPQCGWCMCLPVCGYAYEGVL